MVTELRTRNQSRDLYVRALSQAWQSNIQLHDPSLWLNRDAEVEEKMLRDADIAHAVQYRRHLIAGQNWTLLPLKINSPRSPMAISVATELISQIKHFTQSRLNLSRAFFSGARFARIRGEMRKLTLGDGVERNWWVPTRMEDLDKRMFRIVPASSEGNITATWEHWNVGKMKWETETVNDSLNTVRHVYQDDQASLGHGRALREALGWWWYAKEHIFQESLQAVERFAQGILTAKIDGARDAQTGLPNTALISSWTSVLEDLRARHVLVFDKDDEVETVNVSSSGWELMRDLRAELRSTIMTLILGANLTTSASSGGSYALAEVQENSTQALIRFDRESLEETLTDDLIGCIWHRNHANLVDVGISSEMPKFSIVNESQQNPLERVQVAQTLVGMGIQLSLEDVLKQCGYRKPESGEKVIDRQSLPSESPFTGQP